MRPPLLALILLALPATAQRVTTPPVTFTTGSWTARTCPVHQVLIRYSVGGGGTCIQLGYGDLVGIGSTAADIITENWTAGAGGVAANTFVTLDTTTPGQVIATTVAGTTWYGVAMATAAVGTPVLVRRLGSVQVTLDSGTATIGNSAILSATVAGNAHDSGLTRNAVSVLNSVATIRTGCAVACAGTLITVEITPADRGTLVPVSQVTGAVVSSARNQPNGYLGLDGNGNAVVGTTVLDPVTGVNDPNPVLLPKWRLALAKQQTGTKDAKILLIGDSTTAGLRATNVATSSYPARLAAMLTGAALGVTPMYSGVPDPRWTVGAGWAQTTVGFASNSAMFGGAGTLTFTPGGGTSYDSFDVYVMANSGSSTITMTATGGTPVVSNLADGHLGSPGIYRLTATAAVAAITNAIVFSSSGTLSFLIAVEPFLSTTKRIRVGNAGVSGSTAALWATRLTGGFQPFDSISTITTYQPDLCIIDIGINDANGGISADSLQANLTSIVAACQLSGDAILKTMTPSSGAPYIANEALYQPMFRSLSQSLGVPLLDGYTRYAGTWQTAFMADALHPNDQGYLDIAGMVRTFLARIQ